LDLLQQDLPGPQATRKGPIELHPCSALSSGATLTLCGELIPMSITRSSSVSFGRASGSR